MLAFCLILLLTMHLICVNVAAGGPMICLWLERREGRGDALAGRLGRYLASTSWKALLAGAGLGVCIGFVVWTPEFSAALGRLKSKVLFGVLEVVFSWVLMLVHGWLWKRAPDCSGKARFWRCWLPFLAGTNLLYHFPVFFAIVSKVAGGAVEGDEAISSADFRSLVADGEILAKMLHFWLASFAVCAMVMIGYGLRLERLQETENARRVMRWAGVWGLNATALQVPVGIWLMLELPAATMQRLLGGGWLPAGLMGASIGLTLSLLGDLAALAFGNASERKQKIRPMISMAAIVLAMTAVLKLIA